MGYRSSPQKLPEQLIKIVPYDCHTDWCPHLKFDQASHTIYIGHLGGRMRSRGPFH